jgi:hypothetical protein
MGCSMSYIRNSFIFCLIFRCFLIFRNAGRFFRKNGSFGKTQIPSLLLSRSPSSPFFLFPRRNPLHARLTVIGPFVHAWPSILPNGPCSTSGASFTSWLVLVRPPGYTQLLAAKPRRTFHIRCKVDCRGTTFEHYGGDYIKGGAFLVGLTRDMVLDALDAVQRYLNHIFLKVEFCE